MAALITYLIVGIVSTVIFGFVFGSKDKLSWWLMVVISILGAAIGGTLAAVSGIFISEALWLGMLLGAFLGAFGFLGLIGVLMVMFLPENFSFSGPRSELAYAGSKGGQKTVIKNDFQIKQDVLNQLAWDSRVDTTGIEVQVNRGVVTLTGITDSLAKSREAERVVRHILGVTEVINRLQLELKSELSVSDEDIFKSVFQALEWNQVLSDLPIKLWVESSVVYLGGKVESLWQKLTAEAVVRQIIGVKAVVNQLEVVPVHRVDDDQIANRVRNRIEKYSLADINDIEITVSQGKVYLSGVIPSWVRWEDVYNAALYTHGVTGVEDNLVVVGSSS